MTHRATVCRPDGEFGWQHMDGDTAGSCFGAVLLTGSITLTKSSCSSRASRPRVLSSALTLHDVPLTQTSTVAHLDKMTAKHVLPGFNDRSAEEALIERVTQDITHDFRRCQAHIRKIADYAKYMRSVMHQAQSASNSPVKSKGKGREGPPSTEKFHEKDLVMATNVQIALATKVQDQSAIFRKRQSNYLKRALRSS